LWLSDWDEEDLDQKSRARLDLPGVGFQSQQEGPQVQALRESYLQQVVEEKVMAKKRKKSGAKRSWKGCGCPASAVKVSTKGHGRGFVCISKQEKTSKRNGLTYVSHPFVKATCGRR
jgi:hypothetical protein